MRRWLLLAALLLPILPADAAFKGAALPTTVGALSTAQLDKTSNTTLSNVAGLAIPLTAGASYSCSGALMTAIGAANGGIKFALSNGDTLTTTSFRMGAFVAGVSGVQAAALGTTIGAALTNPSVITWDAGIVVNAAGTLVLQAAQVNSDPATTSVLTNSTMRCTRL